MFNIFQLSNQLYETISLEIVYSYTITASVIGLLVLILRNVTNRLDMYKFEKMINKKIAPQIEYIHETIDLQYEDLYTRFDEFDMKLKNVLQFVTKKNEKPFSKKGGELLVDRNEKKI